MEELSGGMRKGFTPIIISDKYSSVVNDSSNSIVLVGYPSRDNS